VSQPKAKESKSTSARKKAEVARSEKKDEAKQVDFRGLTLHLPAKLPGTILFDLADLEAGRDLSGTMEFIKSLVGAGQYQAIRNKVGEENIPLDEVDDVLLKLLEDILETSGLGSGE
jgi:hypothetical protein